MNDVERYREQFAKLSDEELHALIATGHLGEFKRGVAVHALGERERARSAASAVITADLAASSAADARRSADAAEIQARAAVEANAIARRANTIAIIAMIMAVVAVAVSMADFLIG